MKVAATLCVAALLLAGCGGAEVHTEVLYKTRVLACPGEEPSVDRPGALAPSCDAECIAKLMARDLRWAARDDAWLAALEECSK